MTRGESRGAVTVTGYGARHLAATAARGRLCVGIDPHAELLLSWGLTDDADGLARFADICVDAFAPIASVVKPQVAFFERFGSRGFAVLEDVIARMRAAGVLVLADAKRGDIGSTMSAYAWAWLDDASPLCADSVTASPYLGFGSLEPALELAHRTDRGVFVLARTSNPEGGGLQTALISGATIGQSIVDEAAARNADGCGSVGLVVGATRAHGLDLSALNGPILSPGLGAQGATPQDMPEVFAGADPRWVLPASSRGVLRAGPDVAALRAAATSTRDEIESAFASHH